jgi:RNA polymerase sigma-70 factor (ECF subfamily)
MSTWTDLDGTLRPGLLGLAAAAGRTEVSAAQMTLGQRVTDLFKQFRDPVFRYLMTLCRDAHQSEEHTQEVFLRLYRHLHEGHGLENPIGWLFQVARNLVVDASRAGQAIADLDEAGWNQLAESRAGAQPDPEQLALQRERLERVHLGIRNLTPLQRQCLHLRVEGLRYREIADLLNISVATVADAVRRGLVNLAARINPEEKP